MARKLNSEEEHSFAQALRQENLQPDDVSGEFLSRFNEKRDTAVRLSPELAVWFNEDPFGPLTS